MSSGGQRFEAGDCFLILGHNAHLWIVLSDPTQDPDEVVMVNITTYLPYKDNTCLLDNDAHPWIKHRSCVNFGSAQLTSVGTLTSLEASGKLVMQEPLAEVVYKDIFGGAFLSSQIKRRISDLLYEQGLSQRYRAADAGDPEPDPDPGF